jgi:hypothetical protein
MCDVTTYVTPTMSNLNQITVKITSKYHTFL